MRERDPWSESEDEGIPDLQDGTPHQQWAEDPQEHPLPAEEPVAVDEHGTTAAEQRSGEDLEDRLEREEPEAQPYEGREAQPYGENRRTGRIVEPDEGGRTDREKDAIGRDAGADTGGFAPEERAMRIEPEEEAEEEARHMAEGD